MSLFRIPATSANAPARVIEKAQQARDLGYRDVATHYEPATDTHTVTGEPPAVPDTPKLSRFRR